ncbi:hypothetical protein ABVK25_012223 [Lepraria finkii]|uniref:Rhodopsin domain-containing protein n=1 Tax=Lepraria finkii TaxID=1340010 RepID=A0ABR4AH61_9LECA
MRIMAEGFLLSQSMFYIFLCLSSIMASPFPPGVNPATVPAAPPPPGVVPNLVDPENLEAVTIAFSVLMIVFTLTAVALRLYSTVRVTRSTGLEDYFCIIALILLYIYVGFVFSLNKYSRHIWDIPLIWVDVAYFKGRFVRDMFFGPATFFAKSSILLLYLRLFAPKKWLKYTIWSTIAFMFALYFCYIAVNAGLCAPKPGQTWLFSGVLQKCEKQETYAIIQGAVNVAVDLLILILPIPVVLKLRMQRGRKIGILAVFGTGAIALVCSIISLVYRIKLNGNQDSFWLGAVVFIAIIIEVSITIICSCAPAIFSLARHIFSNSPFFASLRSRVIHTNDISNNYTAPSKATYTIDSLDSRPPHTKDNGYLELGEVADIERKLTGTAFERGADVLPPPVRKATDYLREKQKEKGYIRKTTDVDVTYPDNAFGSEGPRGFPENTFARQGPRGLIR